MATSKTSHCVHGIPHIPNQAIPKAWIRAPYKKWPKKMPSARTLPLWVHLSTSAGVLQQSRCMHYPIIVGHVCFPKRLARREQRSLKALLRARCILNVTTSIPPTPKKAFHIELVSFNTASSGKTHVAKCRQALRCG